MHVYENLSTSSVVPNQAKIIKLPFFSLLLEDLEKLGNSKYLKKKNRTEKELSIIMLSKLGIILELQKHIDCFRGGLIPCTHPTTLLLPSHPAKRMMKSMVQSYVCLCNVVSLFFFTRRNTFGHIEATLLELSVLLAQCAGVAPEVDAAVQTR